MYRIRILKITKKTLNTLKNLEKTLFIYYNNKFLLILFVFLLFPLNCNREIIQEKEKQPGLEKQGGYGFFRTIGEGKRLSIYSDKFSSKISVLGIKQGRGVNRAFHIEYILSAISRNSLEESELILSKKIPRFTIRERAILGNLSKNENLGLLELNAQFAYTRTWSDFDLESLLVNLEKIEYSKFPILEKIFFKPKKNYQLWKAEEWMGEGERAYIWRNFEEESMFLPKIPYTEYNSTIGVTYSKISSYDNYLYTFRREETVPLFEFFDFTIGAKMEEEKPLPGNLKEQDKNSLPKLFLVKILNSNGN
jgi:hypothetical protein